VISPSLPGTAFTDANMGRQIGDWPREDLEPILLQERVERFIVHGFSFGTAHALAVGAHFGPKRCVAMGLNGPFLSVPVCKEFGFRCDAKPLPTKRTYDRWCLAWLHGTVNLLLPWTAGLALRGAPEGKALSAVGELDALVAWMDNGIARSSVRGTYTFLFEHASGDVCGVWGFDPRDCQTLAVSIWYAEDDRECPPKHGEWLVELFRGRIETHGLRLDVKAEKKGFGHFTYLTSEYRQMALQTKVLLELARDRL